MKKHTLFSSIAAAFILAATILSFSFILGCGKGAVVDPPPGPGAWIESRSPATGATWNTAIGALQITFTRAMNISFEAFSTGESHTAGDIFSIIENIGWEKTGDGKDFLNVWIAGAISSGEVVLVSDQDGFKDASGNSLPAGTVLWQFTYAYDPSISFSISGNIDGSSTTGTGTIYAVAYDHDPSTGDRSGIRGFAVADPSGNFEITGLGSGEYYVGAFKDNWPDEDYNLGEPWGKHSNAITVGPSQLNKDISLSQPSTFTIASRSPGLDDSGIPATGQIYTITFSHAVDPNTIATTDAFYIAPDHTAGMPTFESEPSLSYDMRTVSITIESWLFSTGNQVHLMSTSESPIRDINGIALTPVPEDLWKCTLNMNSVSGTITGGTSETVAVMVLENFESDTAGKTAVELANGSATYGISGFDDGTYYVAAWSPRSGDFEGDPQPNDLLGIYQLGNPEQLTFNATNRTETEIDFPLTCFVGLGDPVTSPYISGQITIEGAGHDTNVLVAISTNEAFFSWMVQPNAMYMVEPPDVNYAFSGLADGTYYIGALQKDPGNSGQTPESGDYLGTAIATIESTSITDADIYMQLFAP